MPHPSTVIRRARWLEWIAANGPCRICGSWERLEVDHINPADKTTPAPWKYGEARRLAELAKCQVLCYTCHQKKSAAELSRPLVHGTRHGYKNKGCRCRPCTDAEVRYQDMRRKARRATVRAPRAWESVR